MNIKVGDIRGEFDYGVKLNSTTPLDPAAEFTKLNTVYQAVGGPEAELVKRPVSESRGWPTPRSYLAW